jgi:copper chaperone
MAEITLKIDGMSCQHCVMSVKKAINWAEGVSSSDVSVGTARVVYEEPRTNKEKIAKHPLNY